MVILVVDMQQDKTFEEQTWRIVRFYLCNIGELEPADVDVLDAIHTMSNKFEAHGLMSYVKNLVASTNLLTCFDQIATSVIENGITVARLVSIMILSKLMTEQRADMAELYCNKLVNFFITDPVRAWFCAQGGWKVMVVDFGCSSWFILSCCVLLLFIVVVAFYWFN